MCVILDSHTLFFQTSLPDDWPGKKNRQQDEPDDSVKMRLEKDHSERSGNGIAGTSPNSAIRSKSLKTPNLMQIALKHSSIDD